MGKQAPLQEVQQQQLQHDQQLDHLLLLTPFVLKIVQKLSNITLFVALTA